MRTAVLAGMGLLPLEAVKNLKARGEDVTVVAFSEQAAADFTGVTDDVAVMSIGQVGKILKFLKSISCESLVFAGKIERVIIEDLKFDFKALWMLARLKDRQENSIMLAIIKEVEKLGIRVRSQLEVLDTLVIKRKVYSKRRPTAGELGDVEFGLEMARGIADLDIGQTVVVKNKAVLAVEAIEGTNEAIKRGAAYAKGGGFSFVKVARPKQDERFDLPVAGLDTLRAVAEGKGAVCALEADRTLVINLEECIEFADAHKIAFLAV